MTQKEMQTRLNELHRDALASFADKGDFQVWDWLTDEETKEYQSLLIKTGEAKKEEFDED